MMCMAMRFFSWASSTQTLMLEMLETYRISGRMRFRGNGKSKEKTVERKFQTSKLDDTS